MKKEKIALVVDSTCGYTEKEVIAMGGYYAPLSITVDNKGYVDGVDLTEDELIDLIDNSSVVKTAAPSSGLFEEEFKKALKTHDKVFCVTLSKKISSAIQSAIIAKGSNKDWEKKVFICDSFYASAWIKYDVTKMLKMVKDGTTIEELEKMAKIQNEKTYSAFAPTSLVHLKNGGRISGSAAVIGNVLKILPVITWVDGHMDPDLIVKARTFKKASSKCIEFTNKKWKTIEDKENYQVFALVSHKIDEETKEEFIEKVQDKFKLKEKPVPGNLGVALVAHVGPEFLGVGFYWK